MIEVWAGLECTVNRVGDRFFDQVQRTGHEHRVDDMDRLATLGVQRVRYPILWERTLSRSDGSADWRVPDHNLARLRAHAIAPIAGLVHHGSGPRHLSLLHPQFASALASYATSVAERYPWIEMWTPINEPLVTARFAGLYGHWYPHRTDDRSFVRMVVQQALGIVSAMQAVRRVIPNAKLVQTEDGGTVYATAPLQYQADFENARRDLVFDLLFARVNSSHPLWKYLMENCATQNEIAWIGAQGITPDLIGVDYYLTSDRYLDHELSRHSLSSLAGNARQRYADVSAPGHLPEWRCNFAGALARVAKQYSRPVALTEVHVGCTREEQLRWLADAWNGAVAAQANGTDVRAVTSWAVFGSFDWNSLVTRETTHYEPGAFDIRACAPRPTAVAHAIVALAATGRFSHPVLAQGGWWNRPNTPAPRHAGPKVILIFGSRGTLGAEFVRKCVARALPFVALTRAHVDVTRGDEIRRAMHAHRPWAVVNATGYANVDAAEQFPDDCIAANVLGAEALATECALAHARLLTFSSDLVFDGEQGVPYDESATPRALSIYGHSKRVGEQVVRERLPTALVVRTSAFFGPWDEHNFLTKSLRALRAGQIVHGTTHTVSPTYVPALVDCALDLLIDYAEGVWHLANAASVSWIEFAQLAAERAGLDNRLIAESSPTGLGWIASRPRNSALTSVRGALMPTLDESLTQYFDTVHSVAKNASL